MRGVIVGADEEDWERGCGGRGGRGWWVVRMCGTGDDAGREVGVERQALLSSTLCVWHFFFCCKALPLAANRVHPRALHAPSVSN